MGLVAVTVVSGLLLALWGLEELVQPKNVEVPGVSAHSLVSMLWRKAGRTQQESDRTLLMRGAHYFMPISLENYQFPIPLSFIFTLKLSPNIKLC